MNDAQFAAYIIDMVIRTCPRIKPQIGIIVFAVSVTGLCLNGNVEKVIDLERRCTFDGSEHGVGIAFPLVGNKYPVLHVRFFRRGGVVIHPHRLRAGGDLRRNGNRQRLIGVVLLHGAHGNARSGRGRGQREVVILLSVFLGSLYNRVFAALLERGLQRRFVVEIEIGIGEGSVNGIHREREIGDIAIADRRNGSDVEERRGLVLHRGRQTGKLLFRNGRSIIAHRIRDGHGGSFFDVGGNLEIIGLGVPAVGRGIVALDNADLHETVCTYLPLVQRKVINLPRFIIVRQPGLRDGNLTAVVKPGLGADAEVAVSKAAGIGLRYIDRRVDRAVNLDRRGALDLEHGGIRGSRRIGVNLHAFDREFSFRVRRGRICDRGNGVVHRHVARKFQGDRSVAAIGFQRIYNKRDSRRSDLSFVGHKVEGLRSVALTGGHNIQLAALFQHLLQLGFGTEIEVVGVGARAEREVELAARDHRRGLAAVKLESDAAGHCFGSG